MTDTNSPVPASIPSAAESVASARFCIRNLAELLAIMDGRTFIPGTIEREIVKRSGEVMADLVALVEPSVSEPQGWRPIETAPKDGTHILLLWSWDNGTPPRVSEAFWRNDMPFSHKGIWWYFSGRMFQEPSHWMPLPAAPDDISYVDHSGQGEES